MRDHLINTTRASLQSAIALGQISKEEVNEILQSLKNPETKKVKLVSPNEGRRIISGIETPVSLPTFFKFTKKHNIPVRKVGRQNRYLETDLLKAMGISEVV